MSLQVNIVLGPDTVLSLVQVWPDTVLSLVQVTSDNMLLRWLTEENHNPGQKGGHICRVVPIDFPHKAGMSTGHLTSCMPKVLLVSAPQTTKDRTPDRGVQSGHSVSSAVRSHPGNVRAKCRSAYQFSLPV